MIGTGTSRVLLAAVGCLLLASCGAAQSSSAPAGANPAATSSVASPATSSAATSSVATPAATAAAVKPGSSGLTACELITEQDASTALGKPAGQGTPGGSAALSECIYDGGGLIVGMKENSKAFYDKQHSQVQAKGMFDLPGIGDSAFKAGTDQNCTLLFIKGTTIVSILVGEPKAQDVCLAVAKIGASKM